jgi:hypothetical protein
MTHHHLSSPKSSTKWSNKVYHELSFLRNSTKRATKVFHELSSLELPYKKVVQRTAQRAKKADHELSSSINQWATKIGTCTTSGRFMKSTISRRKTYLQKSFHQIKAK